MPDDTPHDVAPEQLRPVTFALTYYAPYVSGLTDAARLVAEDLAARGLAVRVVTTRHDPRLPAYEVLAGVPVHRAPVLARVGKGTVSPAFPATVRRLAASSGVLNLHLPLLEAGLLARLCRGTPLVTTYQCDVVLGSSAADRLQVRAVDASSRAALVRSHSVAVSSLDYARSSRLWAALHDRAVAVAPPCRDRSGGRPSFRDGTGLHVGFLGRLVAEKGLEHLVEAFLGLADPQARLLIGGAWAVAGGSVVEQVRRRIAGDPRIRLLGFVADADLPDFYASLDVFALPSVNALEAFGIVQVEAMIAGVPVVATDLPGVRIPVRRTQFGRIVAPADPTALTAALRGFPSAFDRPAGAARARELYGVRATADAYLALFAAAERAAAPPFRSWPPRRLRRR